MAHTLKISLLIAEDHPANQKLLVKFFRTLPIDITLVGDGQQAIDMFTQKNFDLILMDLEMPYVNGIEATQKIRAQEHRSNKGKRIPIVALTAHQLKEKRKHILINGMDDCIEKPLTHDILLTIMQRWLPGRVDSTDMLDMSLSRNCRVAEDSPLSETQEVSKTVFDLDLSIARANHNIELAKDLFDMLLTDLSNIDMVEHYQSNQQWVEIKNHVHKLHGGCCYSGVPELKKSCVDLESAVENRDINQIPPLCKNLLQAAKILIKHQEGIRSQFQHYKPPIIDTLKN